MAFRLGFFACSCRWSVRAAHRQPSAAQVYGRYINCDVRELNDGFELNRKCIVIGRTVEFIGERLESVFLERDLVTTG